MKRAMAVLRATAPSTLTASPSRTARFILPLPRGDALTEILALPRITGTAKATLRTTEHAEMSESAC